MGTVVSLLEDFGEAEALLFALLGFELLGFEQRKKRRHCLVGNAALSASLFSSDRSLKPERRKPPYFTATAIGPLH